MVHPFSLSKGKKAKISSTCVTIVERKKGTKEWKRKSKWGVKQCPIWGLVTIAPFPFEEKRDERFYRIVCLRLLLPFDIQLVGSWRKGTTCAACDMRSHHPASSRRTHISPLIPDCCWSEWKKKISHTSTVSSFSWWMDARDSFPNPHFVTSVLIWKRNQREGKRMRRTKWIGRITGLAHLSFNQRFFLPDRNRILSASTVRKEEVDMFSLLNSIRTHFSEA